MLLEPVSEHPRMKQVVGYNNEPSDYIPGNKYPTWILSLKGVKNNKLMHVLKTSTWLCCLLAQDKKELCSYHIQMITECPALLTCWSESKKILDRIRELFSMENDTNSSYNLTSYSGAFLFVYLQPQSMNFDTDHSSLEIRYLNRRHLILFLNS